MRTTKKFSRTTHQLFSFFTNTTQNLSVTHSHIHTHTTDILLIESYRHLGNLLGLDPGLEFRVALNEGLRLPNTRFWLIDRRLDVTLQRMWQALSLWSKLKLFWWILRDWCTTPTITKEDIERLKSPDILSAALEKLGHHFPALTHILVNERDLYLTCALKRCPGNSIVAVVGAGHGTTQQLLQSNLFVRVSFSSPQLMHIKRSLCSCLCVIQYKESVNFGTKRYTPPTYPLLDFCSFTSFPFFHHRTLLQCLLLKPHSISIVRR